MVPYHTERLHEGRLISVDIPDLRVPQCGNCGELVFNYSADEQILAAVNAQAKAEIEARLTEARAMQSTRQAPGTENPSNASELNT